MQSANSAVLQTYSREEATAMTTNTVPMRCMVQPWLASWGGMGHVSLLLPPQTQQTAVHTTVSPTRL